MAKVRFDSNLNLIFVDTFFSDNTGEQELLLRLAFDTGAAVTTVSYDLMEYLGYAPERSPETGRLITGSGVEYAPIVKVKRICVANEPIDYLKVYCHNFPPESYVDGVLGLNYLKSFNFNVDYDLGGDNSY